MSELVVDAPAHVLVVDDDARIRELLRRYLRQHGYLVSVAESAAHARRILQGLAFDLMIVDVMMPGENGFAFTSAMRATQETPVLMLTARGEADDRISGLEAGADDYLAKPFHYEELIARLRALVRRASGFATAVLRHGPIELDTSTKDVRVDGTRIDLTAYEYNLLEYMMLHPSKVISKTELTEHLYAQDFERDSNVIEVFVGRLRRKLDPDGLRRPIDTVRGQGYRLADS